MAKNVNCAEGRSHTRDLSENLIEEVKAPAAQTKPEFNFRELRGGNGELTPVNDATCMCGTCVCIGGCTRMCGTCVCRGGWSVCERMQRGGRERNVLNE